jgi:hypothetical protein
MAFDLKSALTSIAPTLATMLAGPFAGTAVAALESACGLTQGSGTDAITKVIQGGGMTPEITAAIRAADQKHAETMGQQGIDLAKINLDFEAAQDKVAADDRDSARKMEIAKHSVWPGVLSALTTAGVLGIIGARMYGLNLPNDPTTVQLIGSLTTGWGMAMAYWLGTTRQSANAVNLLAQSSPVK